MTGGSGNGGHNPPNLGLKVILSIKEIADKIPDSVETDYRFVGIRIVGVDYDDYNAQIGEILPASWCWLDGSQTDERLQGTSALDIEALWAMTSPATHMGYRGDRILIIGGDVAERGNDEDEIIITDAVVIEVIQG